MPFTNPSRSDSTGNDTTRTFHSPSPIYGIPGGFNIADLPAQDSTAVVALTAVGSTTLSAALHLGARSIEVDASFSDAVTTCTLNFYKVTSGGNVQVFTIPGVSETNCDDLFVGGFEGVNFEGLPIIVEATTFVGGGTVTVSIKRTS